MSVKARLSAIAFRTTATQRPVWLCDLTLGKREQSKGNGADTTAETKAEATNGSAHTGPYEFPSDFGRRKLNEFCKIVSSAQKGQWDEARRMVFKFGRWVGGGAMDVNVALAALLKAARECKAPDDYPDEVKRSFLKGVGQPEGPPVEGASLDSDFYAYMVQHNYIFVPTREHWPASSINARFPYGVPVFDNDGKPKLDDKGDEVRIKSSVWLDQNRAVEQMAWAPGEDLLIRDRLLDVGGWIKKPGATCFNLYKPPIIEPGDAGKAGPWLEHVHKLLNDEDAEHTIKWMAQRVQHPDVKINHALVLGSEAHGIGKDAMLYPVKWAVGPWNFLEANPQQAMGKFNGFFRSVILRISEVRDLGDVNRYQFYDHTKSVMATPPETLQVEEKFLRAYWILNVVGIILTTNYKTNGIYLDPQDRRHYVAWSNLSRDDFEDGYWNRLFGWYDAGGSQNVAAYLRELDISTFDPKATPPQTEAFWDIVNANRSPQDAELADVLDKMGNPKATTIARVAEHADVKFAGFLRDPANRKSIPYRFTQCGYVAVKNPSRNPKKADASLWKVDKRRQVVFALSDMNISDQIAAARELASEPEPGEQF